VDPGGVEALAAGRAFVDLSAWRKVGVSGGDAIRWLDRLVTADLADLGPGRARQALLLSPSGGVLAAITVAVVGGSVLLVQDPREPRPALDLLSSLVAGDVGLDDRTDEIALFAFPNRPAPPDLAGCAPSVPSCLGPGADLFALAEDREAVRAHLARAVVEVGPEEVEWWRVGTGIPRVGVDVTEEDRPVEAGLAHLVASKETLPGGQALGAPPRRLLVRVEADAELAPGEPLFRDASPAGRVTSTAGRLGLASVAPAARDGPLRTAAGIAVRVLGAL
jgi:glycine cleavage system aminomethyltransferase T